MSDTALLTVDSVSKKFCRSLKKSLWYGVKDLFAELKGDRGDLLTLRADEFWAVDKVSFELHEGETLGLIGPNGAGKSTLLRVVNGLLKPDHGSITIRGRMQALIALGAGFNPVLTGRENIYVNASVLGIPKSEVDKRFDEIVDFAGIPEFIDAPVQTYSSGMNVRLGFAVASHLEPDILLVDEVLAVGDEGFQTKCLNKIGDLKHNGTALVLVSHNMHTVSTYSDRILLKTSSGHQIYDEVSEGVRAYKNMFTKTGSNVIEKIVSGTEQFIISDVRIPDRVIPPGGTITVLIDFLAKEQIPDIEIDSVIRSSNENSAHFQASNHSFDKRLDIPQGPGTLELTYPGISINNAQGSVSIAIWRKERSELMFWWRIPLDFSGGKLSSGSSHYKVSYRVDTAT